MKCPRYRYNFNPRKDNLTMKLKIMVHRAVKNEKEWILDNDYIYDRIEERNKQFRRDILIFGIASIIGSIILALAIAQIINGL